MLVLPWPAPAAEVAEATTYVETYFAYHYDQARDFRFPTTHTAAEAWLTDFLARRLAKFRVYDDALVAREPVLYHSVLTPLLNVSLLSAQQILDATSAHVARHEVPLNSLEGFGRQLMSWREFIRIVYERGGTAAAHAQFLNDWQVTWDGLFWRFLHVNRDFSTKNPRLGMLVRTFGKMSDAKRAARLAHAKAFLAKPDEWNEAA